MTSLTDYIEGFDDEPGYFDFARMGPVGRTVQSEDQAMTSLFSRARFGSLATLDDQDLRVRTAVASMIGFDQQQVVFQPNTSQGLMHVMFGLTGEVAISPQDFPSSIFAITRAADALHAVTPLWLETDLGRITPGTLRAQLRPSTIAVVVSLVDFRTGYLADLEGIRQVIGDRLLIVDAIQGFGVVDAPWECADVIVSGGQKWVRAGWGTGFLALSDRAVDQLTPVWSGFSATDSPVMPLDGVLPPARGPRAFAVTNPDPIAQARFAAAVEDMIEVGVDTISEALGENTERLIALADEFGVMVVSPREMSERAGLVVLHPEPERLTALTASLHNHAVTVTVRQGVIRLSPHVTTDQLGFDLVRSSLRDSR